MPPAYIHPKTAQSLARHSTITLTMDRYTHTRIEDDAEALASLPSLEAEKKEMSSTGNDGPVESASSSASAKAGNDCNRQESHGRKTEGSAPACDAAERTESPNGEGLCSWAFADSNREPADYESAALTN